MLKLSKSLLALTCLAVSTIALADTTVTMNFTSKDGTGKSAGTVLITETKYGLLFTPDLHDLTPGAHGFHVHQNPSCGDDGMAAGGHLDPKNTGKHLGPYNDNGHLGDLPVLYVNSNGTATTPLLDPRLHHIKDIDQHALMVHNAGDNYSDTPEKLGGGGSRMVCGIIK